uniref:DH domain-containing protein n=1 Tax=Schistocephalus solidus TaxID=70667 RepID=A0A0X3P0A0_SCHSO
MGNSLLLFLLLDSSYKDSVGVHVRGKQHILGRNWTMSLPIVRSKQEEVKNAKVTGETDWPTDEDEPQTLRLRRRRAAFVDTKTEIGETDNSETLSNNNLLTQKKSEEPLSRISEGGKYSKNILRNQHSDDEIPLTANSSIRDIWKTTNQAFLKLVERKPKNRESNSAIIATLKKLKPSVFQDKYLAKYATSQLSPLAFVQQQKPAATPLEQKRLEAVWELFLSEVTFLSEHIMVLKHCFSEPLKAVQVEGHLMFVEPSELFGNLDELCYVRSLFQMF